MAKNSRRKFTKDPNARLDYTIDWASWLTNGDFLFSSTWSVEAIAGDAAPLAIVADPGGNPAFDNLTATVWVEGGTRGKTYTVTNAVVTQDGRQDERSIFILIGNK